jgi:glutaredoxin-related protein
LVLLMGRGIKFETFDILSDENIRAGMKKYSSWPTFPQVFIGGSFVGGLDVVKDLDAEQQLLPLIPAEARIT